MTIKFCFVYFKQTSSHWLVTMEEKVLTKASRHDQQQQHQNKKSKQ